MQGPPKPVQETKASSSALRDQIAALQAQLAEADACEPQHASGHQDDDNEGEHVLAAQSPSPKKVRTESKQDVPQAAKRRLDFHQPKPGPPASSIQAQKKNKVASEEDRLASQPPERPSSLLTSLEQSRHQLTNANARRNIQKPTNLKAPATVVPPPAASSSSASFGKEPAASRTDEAASSYSRDDSLRLIEDLKVGPYDHYAPSNDPLFNNFEPNSRIRIKPGSRVTSHEDIQDYLDARYYISPSLLYSIIRPGRGNEMEVPVEADYIVIGVLAEKSGIKMTEPKQQLKPASKSSSSDKKGKGKQTPADDLPASAKTDGALQADEVDDAIAGEEPEDDSGFAAAPRKQKRFVKFKLLDMRLKRDGLSSAGDSMLNLIMFEADSSTALYEAESDDETVSEVTGARLKKEVKKGKKTQERSYKGGSGGAYERFWKEQDGAIVAILNPKVLKPRPQYGQQQQHHTNVLTITPESAESVVVIGKSQDLGTCTALRRDGQPCTAWCDKRVSDACDFHVSNALQKTRSGRSELMVGTSALTKDIGKSGPARNGGMFQGKGRLGAYDPINKTGLLPRDGKRQVDGVSTYVVKGSGNSQRGMTGRGRGGGPGPGTGFPMPSDRREKEDATERKKRREAEERTLFKVLKRDDGKSLGAKYLTHSAKPKSHSPTPDRAASQEAESQDAGKSGSKKRVFDAAALRAIGYDPTRNESMVHLDEDSATKRRRMDLVSSLELHGSGHAPKLGHAPNYRRSNVSAPAEATQKKNNADPSSDDDLVVLPADTES